MQQCRGIGPRWRHLIETRAEELPQRVVDAALIDKDGVRLRTITTTANATSSLEYFTTASVLELEIPCFHGAREVVEKYVERADRHRVRALKVSGFAKAVDAIEAVVGGAVVVGEMPIDGLDFEVHDGGRRTLVNLIIATVLNDSQ